MLIYRTHWHITFQEFHGIQQAVVPIKEHDVTLLSGDSRLYQVIYEIFKLKDVSIKFRKIKDQFCLKGYSFDHKSQKSTCSSK